MSKKPFGLIGRIIIFISLILMTGLNQRVFATNNLSQGIDISAKNAIAAAAEIAVKNYLVASSAIQIIVDSSEIKIIDNWAIGSVALIDDVNSDEDSPEWLIFLATKSEEGWEIVIGGTRQFTQLLSQTPDALVDVTAKQILGTVSQDDVSAQATAKPNLSLPFPVRTSRFLTKGPHHDAKEGAYPRNSLDFAAARGESVVSADSGVVVRPCGSLVVIYHSNGWQTGYYHMENIVVSSWTTYPRGQHLGNIGERLGCGGSTRGPHLHFTLWRDLPQNGGYPVNNGVDLNGIDIGGWRVQNGPGTSGCMLQLRNRNNNQCSPVGQIYNDGTIGSGYTTTDYDLDGMPDIWAVNRLDVNNTALHIVSGANPQQFLLQQKTILGATNLNWSFAVADYDKDNVPDLWAINRVDGANTALHIVSGANPQQFLLQQKTILGATNLNWSFAVADYNGDGVADLWAINRVDGDNTSLDVVSGANLQEVLVHFSTDLGPLSRNWSFTLADYNNDNRLDVWAINRQDGNNTSLHIISGVEPHSFLYEQVLPLNRTDTPLISFEVSDHNQDGIPDLWVINRANDNQTALKIISVNNMQELLPETKTALPKTDNDRWFIGGDLPTEFISGNFNAAAIGSNVWLAGNATAFYGVQRTRFTVKLPGKEWHVLSNHVIPPYTFIWNTCAIWIPNGPIEIGFDILDNQNNWSLSPGGTKIINNFTFCPSPWGAAPLLNYYPAVPPLTWSPISWATSYDIQVNNKDNFDAPLEYENRVGDLQIILPIDLVVGKHYWRVRGCNALNVCGEWGLTQEFTLSP